MLKRTERRYRYAQLKAECDRVGWRTSRMLRQMRGSDYQPGEIAQFDR